MTGTTDKIVISKFLDSIGLGNVDVAYLFMGASALILILLILYIIQLVQVSKLKKRMNKFMLGKDGKSLEKDIIGLYEDNKFIKINMDKNKTDIRTLFKKAEFNFQKMGIVKYDAFKQMGGQLSFCLVLLNERNDGFMINSVHSSEGCYSYTKEIKNGESDISLGEEEKKALDMAMGE